MINIDILKKYFIGIMVAFIATMHAQQTIEEKLNIIKDRGVDNKTCSDSLDKINEELSSLKCGLHDNYNDINKLIECGANESDYDALLKNINSLKREISDVENRWRECQSKEIASENDLYGIWEQEEINFSKLIVEYGSCDYLYVIPPEIAVMKLHIHSSLTIPRESWSDLLDGILKYNGVGYKLINQYTKQLYLLKQDLTAISCIITHSYQMDGIDDRDRVAYIYSVEAENLKQAFYFLERVRDQKSTFVYQVGQKIAIIGFKEDVKKLITLCENVWEDSDQKVTRVIAASKIHPDEIIKILKSFFGGLSDNSRSMMVGKSGNDLSAIPLSHDGGVVLIGNKSVVEKAQAIIKSTESQVDDPFELTVFWYTCSHSSPVDLAEILEKVYYSLISSTIEGKNGVADSQTELNVDFAFSGDPMNSPGENNQMMHHNDVAKKVFFSDKTDKDGKSDGKNKLFNFIPYPSSGSILMVVRRDTLDKLKDVIKKLDIPKRMVEIEVLLCERRFTNTNRSGINLLRLGTNATNANKIGTSFNDPTVGAGLFEFFFSNKKRDGFPAYDVVYNFLLSQEDIRVTASPSVLTINQKPATISITDQISINNGAAPIQANQSVIFKETFERADFGITITLTPTVHEPTIDDLRGKIYITLENDISFETIKGDRKSDRPDVHKRHVKNHVRVLDGQTIVLGGLRSKSMEDSSDKIPFLGEIPGLAKLFGTSVLNDKANEMFIFIKPKVIHDPNNDLIKIREEKLRRRPGDHEDLLQKIKQSRKRSEERRFSRSFNLLFGNGEGD